MIAISTALSDSRLNAVISFLALGTTPAMAHVYDGIRPALGEAPTGNLLVAIALAEPLGTVSSGVLTVTPTADAVIGATGNATWARVINGDGGLAWDCDVSDLNGSGELRMPVTTLYAGGAARIVAGTLG